MKTERKELHVAFSIRCRKIKIDLYRIVPYAYLHIFRENVYAIILDKGSLSCFESP